MLGKERSETRRLRVGSGVGNRRDRGRHGGGGGLSLWRRGSRSLTEGKQVQNVSGGRAGWGSRWGTRWSQRNMLWGQRAQMRDVAGLSRSRGKDTGGYRGLGGRGSWGVGTHLSAGQGAPGHGERAIQLSRVIVLQRRVQLVSGGPRAGGSSTGARGWGRGRSGGSDFRVGSPRGGVRGGRRLLFLLQLPESAEGHGSGARRPATLGGGARSARRGCLRLEGACG